MKSVGGEGGMILDAATIISRYQDIGRERALTEEESLELERAIRRAHPVGTYRRWSLEDNRLLLIAAKHRGGLKDFAERNERTYASCQRQLDRLKVQRRRRGIATVGRFYYDGEVEA